MGFHIEVMEKYRKSAEATTRSCDASNFGPAMRAFGNSPVSSAVITTTSSNAAMLPQASARELYGIFSDVACASSFMLIWYALSDVAPNINQHTEYIKSWMKPRHTQPKR